MKALKVGLLSIIATFLIGGYLIIGKAEPVQAERTSLGDLIVLNSLFGNGGGDWNNLAGLIAVDRLTGGDTIGTGETSLGDLIVLNSLFDGGFGNTRDLAGLIVLDDLFR